MAASSSGGVMTQMAEPVSYRPTYYSGNVYRGANEAPGWRRIISNGDVVYVSPSGIALHNIAHVKDYLLVSGTCKCGLPCPLHPDMFFNFNSEIPTQHIQSPKTSSCLHHINSIKKGSDWSMSNISNAPSRLTPNPASSATQISELHKNSPSPVYAQQHNTVESASNSPQHQQPSPQSNRCETKIGNMNLSKTPPWQKNSILNQQPKSTTVTSMPMAQQERESPQPQQPPPPQLVITNQEPSQQVRYIHTTTTQPPWHEETQKRLLKTRLAAAANNQNNKKRPNFKDDPSGYLEQQTALLQSSILNVVQNSPIEAQESLQHAVKSLDNNSKPLGNDGHHNHHHPQLHKRSGECLTNGHSNHNQQQPQNVALPYNSNSGGSSNFPSGSTSHEDSQFVYLQRNNTTTNSCDNRLKLESPQHQQQPHLIQTSQQTAPYDAGEIKQDAPQHQSKYHGNYQQRSKVETNQPQPQHPQRIAVSVIPSNRRINVQCVQSNQMGVSNNDPHQPKPRSIFITPANTHQFTATIKKGDQQVLVLGQRPNNFQQHTAGRHENNINDVDAHYTFNRKKIKMVMPSPESSSVSSSTAAYCEVQPVEINGRPPAQVGAISTSNVANNNSNSSSQHSESSSSTSSSTVYLSRPASVFNASKMIQQPGVSGGYNIGQLTSAKNTITSVLAGGGKGRAITATSTSNYDIIATTNGKKSIVKSIAKISKNKIQTDAVPIGGGGIGNNKCLATIGPYHRQEHEPMEQTVLMPFDHNGKPHLKPIKTTVRRMPVSHAMSAGIQFQTMSSNNHNNADNHQTSHQTHHNQNQFLINSSGQIIVMPNSGVKTSNLMQSNNSVVLNSNPVHVIQSSPSPNVLLNNANAMTNNNKLISMGTGVVGQQTVLLNAMPTNSYVLQPQAYATSVDGQVLHIQQNNQQNNQQHNLQLVTTHDDKQQQQHQRQNDGNVASQNSQKARKRKSESLSPQSPQTAQTNNATVPLTSMLQIHASPQYHHHQHHQSPQGFHISPGVSGIALSMNKGGAQSNAAGTSGQSQQIILQQNGQTILQPVNLIGQQLLVPAGHLMMTPDASANQQTTTLLQIQNVTQCGNLLAPQQMMYHHRQSPHNKTTTFLTPAASPGATGAPQQYIVNGNGQISPIGQVYTAPMSLIVPQQATGGTNATFVQQNQTQQLMQQHHIPTMMENSNAGGGQQLQQQRHQNSISPPDTTTHSPRIPERPPSEIGGSSGDVNMVQLVSSSEPDSVFSPALTDGEQSQQSISSELSTNSHKMMGTRNHTPSPEKVLTTNRVAIVSAAALRDTTGRK